MVFFLNITELQEQSTLKFAGRHPWWMTKKKTTVRRTSNQNLKRKRTRVQPSKDIYHLFHNGLYYFHHDPLSRFTGLQQLSTLHCRKTPMVEDSSEEDVKQEPKKKKTAK